MFRCLSVIIQLTSCQFFQIILFSYSLLYKGMVGGHKQALLAHLYGSVVRGEISIILENGRHKRSSDFLISTYIIFLGEKSMMLMSPILILLRDRTVIQGLLKM